MPRILKGPLGIFCVGLAFTCLALGCQGPGYKDTAAGVDHTAAVQGKTLPTPKPKMIVVPLQPRPGGEFAGSGLAVQFMLGNIIAMHPGLEEFWFSWRTKKIFPTKKALSDYCRGRGPGLDLVKLGKEQKIRYWLSGQTACLGDRIEVSLTLTDTEKGGKAQTVWLMIEPGLNPGGFCRAFLNWLADCGLGFPKEQAQAACWPENNTIGGLDALGLALEAYYLHAFQKPKTLLDPAAFRQALDAAPESYMARDLMGWALFKNQDYRAARRLFSSAMEMNPGGLGAVEGLMWCAIGLGENDMAYKWGAAKARLRGEDPDEGRAYVANRLGNDARKAKKYAAALAYFKNAAALNPAKALYACKLAEAHAKLGEYQSALKVMDQALERFPGKKDQKDLSKTRARILKDMKAKAGK